MLRHMLEQLFEQESWATQVLLEVCERLTPEQLATTIPSTYGTIFETLHHFIESDGHYARRAAPDLWPVSLHADANDAWEASLGGPEAFKWVRDGGPEAARIERRRTAFLSGDVSRAFSLLRTRASSVAQVWITYAASEPDLTARCRFWPESESSAGVQILQAMRHSHEHQEQVRATLSSLGIEPPDLSGLAWGASIGDVRKLGLADDSVPIAGVPNLES
jgi:uncharacterized damage-inducible protein DinB